MQSKTRTKLWPAVLMALVPAMGCANETAPNDGNLTETPTVESQSLQLTTRTQTAVAGVFRRGSIVIGFDAVKSETGSSWALYQGDGKELFRVEQVKDAVVTTTLGAYRQRTNAAMLEKLKAGQMDQTSAMNGIETEGDPSLVLKLRALPEFAEIQALSRALSDRGINGKAYPATFGIHSMAAQVNRELGGAPAAPVTEPSKTPQGFAPGTQLPQCYTSGNQTCCRLNSTQPYRCNPTPRPLTCEEIYPLPDLRCDPNHDQCFGMCGDGCSCWDGLCGDCTYHVACAQHDWFCRQVQGADWYEWTYNPSLPFFAAQCYGGVSAIIALIGCQ